jgi:hypothetical protein
LLNSCTSLTGSEAIIEYFKKDKEFVNNFGWFVLAWKYKPPILVCDSTSRDWLYKKIEKQSV